MDWTAHCTLCIAHPAECSPIPGQRLHLSGSRDQELPAHTATLCSAPGPAQPTHAKPCWSELYLPTAAGERFGKVRGESAGIRGEYVGVIGEYGGMRGEYGGVRGESAGIRGEYVGVVGEYGGTRGEYGGVVGEYGGMRGEYVGVIGE